MGILSAGNVHAPVGMAGESKPGALVIVRADPGSGFRQDRTAVAAGHHLDQGMVHGGFDDDGWLKACIAEAGIQNAAHSGGAKDQGKLIVFKGLQIHAGQSISGRSGVSSHRMVLWDAENELFRIEMDITQIDFLCILKHDDAEIQNAVQKKLMLLGHDSFHERKGDARVALIKLGKDRGKDVDSVLMGQPQGNLPGNIAL